MQRVLTVILLLCLISGLGAQEKILYDLDDYKQVDFRLAGVDLNPSGSVVTRDQLNTGGVRPSFVVTAGASLDGFINTNSKDQQTSSTYDVNVNVSDGRYISASVDGTVRNYIDDEVYWIHNPDVSVLYEDKRGISVPADRRTVNGGYGFGLGFGRIENVGQARTAVLLLQSLEDKQLLERVPTLEDVTSFADQIGRLEGTRFFDDRLGRIKTIETITEYLIASGLIREASISTVLMVEDAYTFDRVQDRFSGRRFEMTMNTDLWYQHNQILNQDLRVSADVRFEGMLNWTRYDNMDVHWMRRVRGFSTLTYSDYNAGDFGGFDNRRDDITGTLGGQYGYSYAPNLRNRYSIFANAQITLPYELDANKDHFFNEAIFNGYLFGSYNHYFTPRTQVTLSTFFTYEDREFQAGTFSPALDLRANFQVLHGLY